MSTIDYEVDIESPTSASQKISEPSSCPKKHKIAKAIHKSKIAYILFGAGDGVNLSYSLLKYICDLVSSNKGIISSDLMHELMHSPWGAVGVGLGAAFITTFSFLGNFFDDEDSNRIKRWIACAWPYFRDVLKSLKNSYKGVRSTLLLASWINGESLKYLAAPIGLGLGCISVLNRLWFRKMLNERKRMTLVAANNLEDILNQKFITYDQAQAYRSIINAQCQKNWVRKAAFFSATLNGVVDGMYLFMGALTFASLTPPVFLAMSIICVAFSALCILVRVFEEYDYQQKLLIIQDRANMVLSAKELASMLLDWQVNHESEPEEYTTRLLLEMKIKLQDFDNSREALKKRLPRSFGWAVLSGCKEGLYIYSAISGLMFAISVVLSMCSVAFPPLLLLGFVGAGIVAILSCITEALIVHSRFLKKSEEQNNIQSEDFELFRNWLKEDHSHPKLKQIDSHGVLMDEADINLLKYDPTLDVAEVFRSFFSGFSKGQKFIEFTGNSLQEPDMDGHYQDSPVMAWFSAGMAVMYCSVLTLRAYARGFGRPPLDGLVPIEKTNDLTVGKCRKINYSPRFFTPCIAESIIPSNIPSVGCAVA